MQFFLFLVITCGQTRIRIQLDPCIIDSSGSGSVYCQNAGSGSGSVYRIYGSATLVKACANVQIADWPTNRTGGLALCCLQLQTCELRTLKKNSVTSSRKSIYQLTPQHSVNKQKLPTVRYLCELWIRNIKLRIRIPGSVIQNIGSRSGYYT